MDSECRPDAGINHAVVIVGIKQVEGTLSWVVQNSWGADWGDNGFFYIAIEEGLGLGNINLHYWQLTEIEDN